MQVPPIDDFRLHPGTAYGPPWSVEVEGAGFTLTIPDGDPGDPMNGEERPHRASYEMALFVLPQVGALTEEALTFLEQRVDFRKLALRGEPVVRHIACDARKKTTVLELAWTEHAHVRLGVLFSWWLNHPQLPNRAWPKALTFRFV